jgi:hypothetical protein
MMLYGIFFFFVGLIHFLLLSFHFVDVEPVRYDFVLGFWPSKCFDIALLDSFSLDFDRF